MGLGRRPGAVQQVQHGGAAAGHAVHHFIVGVVGKAVQGGLLLAQRDDLRRHRAVVVRAVLASAGNAGAPQGFAQVASAGVGQEGLGQRR